MKKKQRNRLILIMIAVLVVGGIIIALLASKSYITGEKGKESSTNSEIGNKETEGTSLEAGYSIEVVEIGSYSGPYMEDASDQDVSDVLMIKVRNTGEEPIQYAEITLFVDGKEAGLFKLSTLMPEETMVVLESNKQEYNKKTQYSQAVASNVALFQNELNLYTDKFEIQPLDGGFNIINISEEDVKGEIVIYFKDYEEDNLLGGVTYRGRIEGGLEKGEIRQLMSTNFTENNTRIMFITIDGK